MQLRNVLASVTLIATLIGPLSAKQRLDSWIEAPRLFVVADKDSTISPSPEARAGQPSKSALFTLDVTDFRTGDFSVLYTAGKAKEIAAFGFTPGPYQQSWPLSAQWSLHLWLKDDAKQSPPSWPIVLIDAQARKARSKLAGFKADGQWREFDLPFKKFRADKNFDFQAITACLLQPQAAEGTRIWLDGIYFTNPSNGAEIGVTDKTIEQRTAEIRQSRPQRVKLAFQRAAQKPHKNKGFRPAHLFAKLWLNQQVEEVNAELLRFFSSKDPQIRETYWSLTLTPLLCRFYFTFGSQSDRLPDRITPQVEKALLELIWDRTVHKNNIYIARQSTWWMHGSENHDMNARVSSILASQIFMHQRDYANRIYPNHGGGGGSAYWGHKRPDGGTYYGREGRANNSDGKEYTAKDHYEAWVKSFMEYFAERARKGFFVEMASSVYMKYTMSFVHDLYNHIEDPDLKKQTKMFLDLYWADWAQDQLAGMRGGAKTRDKKFDGMYSRCQFLLGGPGAVWSTGMGHLLSDYQLPRTVIRLALDRHGLGSFAFLSRRPGEEPNRWPRPYGNERAVMCDTESRFLRYSWVTPDYILGTQMDHPGAIHCHLSIPNRSQGMSFSTSPHARVFPRPVEVTDTNKWKMVPRCRYMYRSAQHENVLVTQQSRRWFQVHPEWFPATDNHNKTFGIYFGKDLDGIVEKDGWIFVEEGNAYLAVKVILGEGSSEGKALLPHEREISSDGLYARILPDAYDWNDDHTIIKLKDMFSPMIFEAARRADYPTLADFQKRILKNARQSLKLHNTVVPGWHIVTYTGCGSNAQEIYFNATNSEMPMIGGEYIDYSYAQVFDSPYLQSTYNSGIVRIGPADDRITLDFNYPKQ